MAELQNFNTSLYETFFNNDRVDLFKSTALTGAICYTMSRTKFNSSVLLGLAISSVVVYVLLMRTKSAKNNRHTDLMSKILHLQHKTSLALNYLYLEPEVVDFFAEEIELRSFAADSFDRALAICNSILQLKYGVEQGVPRCSADIDTATDLRAACLNAMSEILYNLPGNREIMNRHLLAVDVLHRILRRLLEEMKQDCRETVLEDHTSAPFASQHPLVGETLSGHELY